MKLRAGAETTIYARQKIQNLIYTSAANIAVSAVSIGFSYTVSDGG